MRLKDKVVVITGAKGGLGTYVTQAFLDAGANVIGVSRSIRDADFSHPSFSALPADLADLETALAGVARIDALVHLLGAFSGGKDVAQTSDAELEQMLDLNLRSAFHAMRAVIPVMRALGSGRILAIGSRAAIEPQSGLGVYAASKAALVSLIGTVAVENKSHGITANIVLPGTMDTPANRAAMPGADYSRWVNPGNVAALLVHLASDDSAHINGAVIPIFGGDL
ncbi:MAG: SDR family NAD(P)-dependent oxidoreductase [Bryobacteraceae bacterium]